MKFGINPVYMEGEGAAQNGSGAGFQQKPAQNSGEDGNAAGGENNNENNAQNNPNPWQQPDNNNNQQQKPANQNNQPAPTPEQKSAAADQFIANLRLTENIDTAQIMNDMQQGNAESFQAGLDNLASNVFKQALNQADQLMKQRIDSGIKSAVEQSQSQTNGTLATRQMEDELPYTKEPHIAPMAKQVLEGFMSQTGQDVTKAVAMTKAYFQTMGTSSNGNNANNPGNGGFNNGQNQDGNNNSNNNEDVSDWHTLLNG